MITQKKSNVAKCCILNRLSSPFVAYKFAWGRILNKYAVISLDRQNNDRKVSDCLSLTSSLFVLLTTLTLFIHLKMTIAYSSPRISLPFTYVIMNKTLLILFFWLTAIAIFSHKKNACGLKDLDFYFNDISQT